MTYSIALNFEDGVTRFINCGSSEKVLDAAFRQKINLPMDCSDGVCGTCKCRNEAGSYELGDDYVEDALSADEAGKGYVLTCQMVPKSDCVISVPVASTVAKIASSKFEVTLTKIVQHEDAALEVVFDAPEAPVFLPGQYVNIEVPGTSQNRSYSFSSRPGTRELSFLIKRVPNGLMTGFLDQAKPGQVLTMNGPLGSFYLREVRHPILMLAGGTGLAPFLSMLKVCADLKVTQPIRMYYGVTRDQDLVLVDQLEAFKHALPDFQYTTIVADKASLHTRLGYVTDHMVTGDLNDGLVDTYLCGPPPMVDGVRRHFETVGIQPASFHYEKFTPNAP